MTLAEYLEKSARELATDLGEQWALPYVVEDCLMRKLALRDAEILNKIAIMSKKEEADTIPPENEIKTKVDNSI